MVIFFNFTRKSQKSQKLFDSTISKDDSPTDCFNILASLW